MKAKKWFFDLYEVVPSRERYELAIADYIP
jgi:hypothetical protein